MRNDWVFHLGAAGHPVSWHTYSVYAGWYGIARRAALACVESSQQSCAENVFKVPDIEPYSGQFIIQITNGRLDRSELFFPEEHYVTRQSPDDCGWLVQFHTFPMAIPENIQTMVTECLRDHLKAAGFLIPRAEWRERYPEEAAFTDQFHAELAAAREAGA